MAQEELSADVVIVGGGVAGSLLAYKLARNGARVLLLEAGPRIDRSESVMRFQASVRKGPNSAYLASPFAPHPDTDDLSAYYQRGAGSIFPACICAGLEARPGTWVEQPLASVQAICACVRFLAWESTGPSLTMISFPTTRRPNARRAFPVIRALTRARHGRPPFPCPLFPRPISTKR